MSITETERNALLHFAESNGRNWKHKLGMAWLTGRYPSLANVPVLQALRNTHGPSWLVTFTFTPKKRIQ